MAATVVSVFVGLSFTLREFPVFSVSARAI